MYILASMKYWLTFSSCLPVTLRKTFPQFSFLFFFFGGGEGEGLPYLICRDARRNTKGLKFPILVTLRVSDRSW